MAFEDLAAFIRPGFDLPIRGKSYWVPAPSAEDGLYLQAIMDTGESMAVTYALNRAQRRGRDKATQPTVMTAADRAVLSDEEERHLFAVALGSAFDEMKADAVPWPVLKHAGMTAFLYWTRDEATAERYWSRFGQGKAMEPPATSPTGGSLEDQSTPAQA
jgi:hypothetical protein